ncbi:MAG: nucleotidyltransferase domain-containing protein [Anaerolineae bacterium]
MELTIQAEIEDALTFSPVDVRTINDAPIMVRGNIIQKGIRVYESDHHARVSFEVATLMRYFDYAPAAHRLQRAFLERVRKKGILDGRS